MKHIQTLETRDMAKSLLNGGCGECQTSCQSACKTSCGIANQPCEKNCIAGFDAGVPDMAARHFLCTARPKNDAWCRHFIVPLFPYFSLTSPIPYSRPLFYTLSLFD